MLHQSADAMVPPRRPSRSVLARPFLACTCAASQGPDKMADDDWHREHMHECRRITCTAAICLLGIIGILRVTIQHGSAGLSTVPALTSQESHARHPHAHGVRRPQRSRHVAPTIPREAELELITNHTEYGAILAEFYTACRPERLYAIARAKSKHYATAWPFPHAVLDDIFPVRMLRALEREFPENPDLAKCRDKYDCQRDAEIEVKDSLDDEAEYILRLPYARAFYTFIQSPVWITFLQLLTGVPGLVADSAFLGVGFDQVPPGGYLGIHADFNFHKRLKLHRRVNQFLYLNPGWREEYGGHLQLWDRELRRKAAYLPIENRFLVFSTTDFTYHGNPEPLNTTSVGRARRSIPMYYYSSNRPSGEVIAGRTAYTLQTCESFRGAERPSTCPTAERLWENFGPCYPVPSSRNPKRLVRGPGC